MNIIIIITLNISGNFAHLPSKSNDQNSFKT